MCRLSKNFVPLLFPVLILLYLPSKYFISTAYVQNDFTVIFLNSVFVCLRSTERP